MMNFDKTSKKQQKKSKVKNIWNKQLMDISLQSSVSEKALKKVSKSNPQVRRLIKDNMTREQFYINQRVNKFDKKRPQRIVLIKVSDKINQDWMDAINDAITAINQAAPGLSLRLTDNNPYDIEINANQDDGAWTLRNIIQDQKVQISLENQWESKKRTATHELLHALGFDHEHQRNDGQKYYDYELDKLSNQQRPYKGIHGITAFDPYSIMNYSECQTIKRKNTEPVWKLKKSTEGCSQLSELDKVGLNIIHPPCYVPNVYQPKKSKITKMYYCGRNVMQNHNQPAKSMTNGFCGMGNGANCHACRTLINQEFDELMGKKKWQGWSGMVYCGKKIGKQSEGHDSVCGPDNGPSCEECLSLTQ